MSQFDNDKKYVLAKLDNYAGLLFWHVGNNDRGIDIDRWVTLAHATVFSGFEVNCIMDHHIPIEGIWMMLPAVS